MYIPADFDQSDPAAIAELCAASPLATLVVMTSHGMVANHIPLLAEGDGFIGHVALANPLHHDVTPDMPALAIFTAADWYVSPNWYPSKAQTHRAVPTWNYSAVHVHGTLEFSHAESEKRRVVSKLTTHFESQTNGAGGWRMGDAPGDFLKDKLANIVAFRLHVTRIEAKAKLNQNRSHDDVQGVAGEFEKRGNAGLARAMRTGGQSE